MISAVFLCLIVVHHQQSALNLRYVLGQNNLQANHFLPSMVATMLAPKSALG